jgi:hypothetical protein
VPIREQVDNFPFGFVSPLEADDRCCRHEKVPEIARPKVPSGSLRPPRIGMRTFWELRQTPDSLMHRLDFGERPRCLPTARNRLFVGRLPDLPPATSLP